MGSIDRDPAKLWYNAAGLAGLKTNAFTVTAAQRSTVLFLARENVERLMSSVPALRIG